MGPATFEGVLRQSTPLSYDGSTFVLGVPSEFAASILSNQHRPLIQASLEELAHQPVALVTEVNVAQALPASVMTERRVAAPAAQPRRADSETG